MAAPNTTPFSNTQFQGWASFFGGNVTAPQAPPPSAFGASALGGQPPANGQYTGGWAYPDAWANFYEGKQGFSAPQNQNSPAGALAATYYGVNTNNPNDPNLLGWEQAYGNPQTILQQDQNWAQSLGSAPVGQTATGGWTNPEAWAAFYGGTNGFTAPQNAGSPASALAAASQIAQTSNPQNNPGLLGWVQDFGQPGSVLANTPNWAASLGSPQVNAQGQGFGQTNSQGWDSPLAWAAYYGGFQGFNNGPVDNTLQAAQNWAGVTNLNDPSLLGWELDYGNPQTVVSTIQASPQYQAFLAAQQAAQQAAAAQQAQQAAAAANQGAIAQLAAQGLPANALGHPLPAGFNVVANQSNGIYATMAQGGYVFAWGPATNWQPVLDINNTQGYGGNVPSIGTPLPEGAGGGGVITGAGLPGTEPIFNVAPSFEGFVVPQPGYQPATSGLVLGGGSYTGYVAGAFADTGISPLSNDIIGTSISQLAGGEGIVGPASGSFIVPTGVGRFSGDLNFDFMGSEEPPAFLNLNDSLGAQQPIQYAPGPGDFSAAVVPTEPTFANIPDVTSTEPTFAYTPPIVPMETDTGNVSVDDFGRPIPDVGPPQPFSLPDFGSLVTQDLPPLQLPTSWLPPASEAPITWNVAPETPATEAIQAAQPNAGAFPPVTTPPASDSSVEQFPFPTLAMQSGLQGNVTPGSAQGFPDFAPQTPFGLNPEPIPFLGGPTDFGQGVDLGGVPSTPPDVYAAPLSWDVSEFNPVYSARTRVCKRPQSCSLKQRE